MQHNNLFTIKSMKYKTILQTKQQLKMYYYISKGKYKIFLMKKPIK